MNDQQVEDQVKELGLVYPRVRKERIDQLMASVTVQTHIVEGTTTTVATALLQLGHIQFTLATEISACIDPRNFNAELGANIAKDKALATARNKLWELEGYTLAQHLLTLPDRSARLAHEVNRAYCASLGDLTQQPWETAPEWQRESAINGAVFRLGNPNATPEDMHNSWMSEKIRDGWVYGEVKDPQRKTHPCLVAYSELPAEQRAKDYLFSGVVSAMLGELG